MPRAMHALVVHNDTYVARRLEIEGTRLYGHFYVPPGLSLYCFCSRFWEILVADAPAKIRCSQKSLRLCEYGRTGPYLAISVGPKDGWFFGTSEAPDEDDFIVRKGISLTHVGDFDKRVALFRTCSRDDICFVVPNARS